MPAEQQEHLHDCFEQELGRLVDVDYNNDHRGEEARPQRERLRRVLRCAFLTHKQTKLALRGAHACAWLLSAELMLSIFRLNRVDTCQTLFCSELVVRALQLLGVLQK